MDSSIEIKKYDYIDALRWWAVLWVLLRHILLFFTSDYSSILIDLPARGVQLFYILSALTLFLSLGARIHREVFPYLNFYIRRFFRIAPLFYMLLFYNILAWYYDTSFLEILANLTFMNGWNPYWINHLVGGQWSIAVEATFYLILPFLFIRINSLKSAVVWLISSVVFCLLLVWILKGYPLIADSGTWNTFLFFFFPNQAPVFFMGIVLYFLIKSEKRLKKWTILFFNLVVLLSTPLVHHISTEIALLQPISYTILLYMISAFLAWVTYYISLYGSKLFINTVMIYIGRLSFSMYLVHAYLIEYSCKTVVWLFSWFSIVASQWAIIILAYMYLILTTVILSSVTYICIERPWIFFWKKLITNLVRLSHSSRKIVPCK